MANASAKKAAAAKKQVTSSYLPILLLLNIIHLGISVNRGLSKYRILVSLIQYVVTYFCYQGIVLDAQGGVGSSNKKSLAGGAWLDLLGTILISQFGGLFVGAFMDSLIIILPAGYGVYHKFIKGTADSGESKKPLTPEEVQAKKDLEERRRKRAERRRQKRA